MMLALASPAHAQPADPIPQEQLLTYLDQLTQWQREAAELEPTASNPREVVFRDSVRDGATKVLQSGFDFMRGVAANSPPADVDPESNRFKLMQRESQIENNLRTARGDERRLEEARLSLVRTMLANMNSASNQSPNKLKYTIESLSRSIPELNGKDKAQDDKKTEPKRIGGSILATSAGIFETTRKGREVDDVITKTSQLKDESMALMKQLRAGLGEKTAEEQKEEQDSDKPVVAMTVDERIEAYRRIGEHVVPLAETMRRIDTTRQTLREWVSVIHEQRESLLRRFSIQLGVLIVTLAIPLAVSEMVRRASKHVRDAKRKRQLKAVRRIATGIAIVLILMVNFISDFSSFATFVGFLTAGLAVALQSVLLSLVAHFLFYGRYGVRVGDRIHVAGVTGDIQQVGMLRFYVRELEEGKTGLKPTGKLVAFPNSIVFQNVAFYKYETK